MPDPKNPKPERIGTNILDHPSFLIKTSAIRNPASGPLNRIMGKVIASPSSINNRALSSRPVITGNFYEIQLAYTDG
jgi:hypothetical protein